MKTRDGIRLSDIISAVKGIEGLVIRQGSKHPYMLNYGQLRPCPIAESTDAKYMIVPWLKQILPYDKQTIYSGLRHGVIMPLKKNILEVDKMDETTKIQKIDKMDEIIRIPKMIEGKEFYDKEKNLGVILKTCKDEGYRPLYVPEILDARMNCDKDHPMWNKSFITPSVCVTGMTKGGNKVVVFAHVPNYFSNARNIQDVVTYEFQRGAYSYPRKEFAALLEMEDNKNVFVVDYNLLNNSISGKVSMYNALKHPQVIPFLGGKERAEKYLEKHEKIVGNELNVWHADDLHGKRAYGRMLCIGSWATGGAFNAGYNMATAGNCGHFIGIPSDEAKITRKVTRTRASPLENLAGRGIALPGSKILLINGEDLTDKQYSLLLGKTGPTMDDILDYSRGFMSENGGIIKQNWKSFENGLKEKYKG